MKTQARKTLRFAIGAATLVLVPVLVGETLPPEIKPLRSAQQARSAMANPADSGYEFVPISAPEGANGTFPYGVDDAGLVSGYYVDVALAGHGFLWRNGELSTVDYPGSDNTILGEASNSGLVVGNYGPFTEQHAATYDVRTLTWTTLPDVPDKPINIGDGVNNLGVAVGAAGVGTLASSSDDVGWIWNGSAYSFFTVPGATGSGTVPNGINDRGQIAGYYEDSSGVFHGFLGDGENFTTIDFPGASATFAYGINNRAETSGYYIDASGVSHGFTGRPGQLTTLDVPGAAATFIFGNDDRGDVCGFWQDSAGAYHGFVAFKR